MGENIHERSKNMSEERERPMSRAAARRERLRKQRQRRIICGVLLAAVLLGVLIFVVIQGRGNTETQPSTSPNEINLTQVDSEGNPQEVADPTQVPASTEEPTDTASPTDTATPEEDSQDNPQSEDWQLLLVNRWNKVPEGYEVTTVTLSNGYEVDERIYPDLQEMFDDMREEDIYPVVASGYRTNQRQIEIMNEKIEDYMDEGYDQEDATTEAMKWVAVPGTSEHQTGLAVDINADGVNSTGSEVYQWLAENAWKYGFILRYPQGKESITATDYEAWHYRYVGREYAQEIYESGLCLEEYLGITDQSNPVTYTYPGN
jgi:D-alanyl-D-alanine carboxypeptidase